MKSEKKREMACLGCHPKRHNVEDKINDYYSLGDISAVRPEKYEKNLVYCLRCATVPSPPPSSLQLHARSLINDIFFFKKNLINASHRLNLLLFRL